MRRPSDDDQVSLVEALGWQAQYCAGRGSPIAARICEVVAIASQGALREEFPAQVRFGDLIGLRVMAAVHRLALQRMAPRVAIHLPTLGGTPPTDARSWQEFDAAVIAALLDHPGALARSLEHVPQTNETGRAVLLRRGLSLLDQLGLAGPVRLREIGSSAGLNLRADHLPGNPHLESGPMPPILDRIGCDLHPIDPTTQDGRTTLSSYIWVDDTERFARLGEALQVAAKVPATVQRESALTFVNALTLQADAITLLWHSAMWLYMPLDSRQGIQRRLTELGETATVDSPLVHLSWEWQPGGQDTFTLVLRAWNGQQHRGAPFLLAMGASHGNPVEPVVAEPLVDDPLDI